MRGAFIVTMARPSGRRVARQTQAARRWSRPAPHETQQRTAMPKQLTGTTEVGENRICVGEIGLGCNDDCDNDSKECDNDNDRRSEQQQQQRWVESKYTTGEGKPSGKAGTKLERVTGVSSKGSQERREEETGGERSYSRIWERNGPGQANDLFPLQRARDPARPGPCNTALSPPVGASTRTIAPASMQIDQQKKRPPSRWAPAHSTTAHHTHLSAA